jgi:ArsR family transcriptional regulator
MDNFERLAVIMKALGHQTRLLILEVLREEGEACVCHLEVRLRQRQAYISQQLARLREAGLVTDRRDGMNVFYALADESIGALLDMAHETAAILAQTEGERPLPPPVLQDVSSKCPCPKCRERRASAEATRVQAM